MPKAPVIFEHLVVGPLGCNCYIVGDPESSKAVVIDPGGDVDAIAASLAARSLEVTAIVATHAHFDHVLAAERLRELTGAPFFLHDADKPVLSWLQESGRLFLGLELGPPPEVDSSAGEGTVLRAGDTELHVLHTAGHSPGSISLAAEGMVFAGDALFAGSIGRTDLPGGDMATLVGAIKGKLFPLGDEVVVYPGHGPSTTIEREKRTNPFVGETG
jgi:glyoxylase-like metal-dependent hydrolase (beta-lactamase superfamily II)